MPRYVIRNVPGGSYADVLSGAFYGWLNNKAALAVQIRAGEGKLLATSFASVCTDEIRSRRRLDAMIRHVASPRFVPRREWGPAKGGHFRNIVLGKQS